MKLRKIKNKKSIPQNSVSSNYDMVVFSHIRWDIVYHRPQHIINRLARKRRILYVEAPILNLENQHQLFEISTNLHILQPCVGDYDQIASAILEMVGLKSFNVGWFYSSNFIEVFKDLNFEAIIYDCSEELSLSKFAPENIKAKEKILMSKANYIFSSCEKGFEEKQKYFQNVYLFPNSVDFDHFHTSHNGILNPSDIKMIPEPIVGYFGTIDHKINFELLNRTAFLLPTVSFVMIGPLSNINFNEIPKEPNIYYLGAKSYQFLPNYLKFFNIAMLPFKADETKTATPISTLEYMAGGIPIISTPIEELTEKFSHCLRIVRTCDEFIKEINLALNDMEKTYLDDYDQILNNTSWDKTIKAMEEIIF